MKLYFGNATTAATTVLLVLLLAFIGQSIANRGSTEHWGRRSLLLLILGLVICCFAAARDGLDRTIQCAIDGSCLPGVFPLVSVPTVVGCVGAGIILLSAIITVFVRSQSVREILFYTMSFGIVLKIVTVELARILM